MLLRIRATSFLAGVALASGVAYFQLRQDLLQSQQVLIDQVRAVGQDTRLLLVKGNVWGPHGRAFWSAMM